MLNQEPSVMAVCGLDSHAVYNLRREGYETVDDIARATTDELTDVRYIGEGSAESAIAAATEAAKSTDSDAGSTESDGQTDELNVGSASSRDRSGGEVEHTHSDSRDDADTSENPSGPDWTDDVQSFEYRLLLIGSARPNIHDGEVAGIRVRAALENDGYDLTEFDSVVYSGFAPPSPHHERLEPRGCFDELHDQLQSLASQIPVYYITGDYGQGDPLGTVFESDEYAPGERLDPFSNAQSDVLTYIPIHDTVALGELRLTQNPAIASTHENTLLVTPDLYPELWADHDVLAYVAGGQLPGRYIEDSIAPMYAMENVGPKRPDAAGGVHMLSLTDEGITSHDFVSLGGADLTSCPEHIDRGLQFSHTESDCIFCYNEAGYFEEWLRAGALKARQDRRTFGLEGLVEFIGETAQFTSDQEEDFHEYASQRILEDYVGFNDTGPTVGAQRSVDSPLLPDPRDVFDRAALIASELLRPQPHDRAPYFRRFDVPDLGTTLGREFDDVAPQIPDGMSEAHRELDEAAFDRGELGGEWLLFPKRQSLGTVWERTLRLVADGRLYDAQVATAWHHEARNSRSKRYYLGIGVPNYFDVADVRRVGEVITTEDIVGEDQVFTFKPLFYTRLGIHGRNAREYGLETSSRYTYSDLLKLARK